MIAAAAPAPGPGPGTWDAVSCVDLAEWSGSQGWLPTSRGEWSRQRGWRGPDLEGRVLGPWEHGAHGRTRGPNL